MKKSFVSIAISIMLCLIFAGCLPMMAFRSNAVEASQSASASYSAKDTSNNMSFNELDSIQVKLNSIGYYGFLRSTYTDPRDIDWNEVFYVGAGFNQGRLPENVEKAYLAVVKNDEVYLDLTSVSGKDVEDYVKKTTGFTYSEMRRPLKWVYLKDYDLYIHEHGDTNQCRVQVDAGHHESGEYTISYKNDLNESYYVTFYDEGDSYRFISNVLQTNTPNSSNTVIANNSSKSNGMMIPDSDTRKLSEDDLTGFSAAELRIARNEIYARHGRKFVDKELQAHFNTMDWYTPTIEAKDFDEGVLSEIEKHNLGVISKYEKKIGK